MIAGRGAGNGTGLPLPPPAIKVLDHVRQVADSVMLGTVDRVMSDKPSILVVEDEPLVAEVVADALGDSYRAVVVDNAAEALEQIGLGPVDLVLLDYLLPGGGSSQVLAAANAAGVPVVIMSGDAERQEELSGSYRFVAKPFRIEELISAVNAAIAQR